MTLTTIARRLGAGVIITAASMASLTACGDNTPPGQLGKNQRILATCPRDQKLNQTAYLDMSGTSLSEQIKGERLEIVGQLARRTAVCGGHLSVTAFSSGSAATVSLYNSDLDLDGATTEGRLNRVPAKVEEVVDEISAKYDEAAPQLPTDGTDVAGIYRLAHESQQQLGDGYRLEITILTDGFQNVGGVVLDQETLSTDQARSLADQVAVPDLYGADVTVAGLGRVADDAVPSALVEGLVAFYDRLCENAGAATCTSVTDRR